MKTNLSAAFAAPFMGLALVGFMASAQAASFTQGFNGASLPADWTAINNSTDAANGSSWGTTTSIDTTVAFEGAGFAATDYTATGATVGVISNWLISPEIFGMKNGDVFSFYTTTVPDSVYPDRMEFRLSTAGAGTNVGTTETSVGSFSTALATVNGSLGIGGYPETWTKVSVTLSGFTGSFDGRVAFRYYVDNAGPLGDNSNVIGVDAFSYVTAAVPEPETWGLMIGGLGALAWMRRTKRTAE